MFLDSYNSDKRIEVLGASSDCQFEKLSVNLERLLNTGNIYIYIYILVISSMIIMKYSKLTGGTF